MDALKYTLNLKYAPTAFTQLASANRFAENCKKQHIVMLGECGEFLVACFSDARKLEAAGFQFA